MSNTPNELKYAASHEWARVEEDGTVTVGITDHAQIALGDVVFVELPDVGTVFSAGQEAGVVESVKAASDVYAPVSGEVIEVNAALEEAPEAINADPFTIPSNALSASYCCAKSASKNEYVNGIPGISFRQLIAN